MARSTTAGVQSGASINSNTHALMTATHYLMSLPTQLRLQAISWVEAETNRTSGQMVAASKSVVRQPGARPRAAAATAGINTDEKIFRAIETKPGLTNTQLAKTLKGISPQTIGLRANRLMTDGYIVGNKQTGWTATGKQYAPSQNVQRMTRTRGRPRKQQGGGQQVAA